MAAGKEMEIAIKIAGKVESSFKNALGQAAGGLKNLTKTVAAVTAAAALAIGAMGSAAINVGREFEGAMSQVSATMLLDKTTEEGQKAFETLENAARQCGRETAFSATEAAEALNYLALAGYDADKAATALPTVLKLAGAGAMDLAAASDMVTDSMSALGIEATEENLTAFADNLAMTASKSNTSVAQLGEAILTVGGTAQGLAGGTTELSAALGILADSGIKASEGGTHLRNMILSLQNARNDDAAVLFEKMGISAYDAAGNMRSLGDVFGDLNASLAGASAEKVNRTLATIFKQTDLASARAMLAATADSVESLGTALDASLADSGTSLASLGINLQQMAESFDAATTQEQFAADMLDQYNMTSEQAASLFAGLQSVVGGTGNRFEELSGVIAESAGACEDMYAIQLDNLNGDIAILKSGLSDLGYSVYKDLNGSMRETTQLVTEMVGKLSEAYRGGGMEGMVSAVGGCLTKMVNVAAGYVPQMVSMGIGLIWSLVQGISANAGTLSDMAVQTLAVFADGLFKLVPQILLAGIDIIMYLASSIAGRLPELISHGTMAVTNFVSGIIQRLPLLIQLAGQLISGLAEGIMQALPQLADSGADLMESLTKGIKETLPEMIPAAMETILSFSASLRENAGNLVDAGIQMVMALARSLIENIPVFIQTVPTIITNICGIINDNAPKLLIAGIQLMIELALGLIQSIPVLIENIPQIIQAVIAVFTAFNWINLGGQIVTFIKNGIHNLASAIPQAFRNICANARTAIHNVNWSQLGMQIITFIVNGLRAFVTAVPTILKNIGITAVSWFKSIDWIDLGISIIKGIISGLASMGENLWGMIKSLFAGGGSSEIEAAGSDVAKSYTKGVEKTISEMSAQSAAVVDSYASGIMNNTAAVTAETDSMMTNAFSNLDLTSVSEAGSQAGTAFATGLTDSQMVTQAVETLGTDVNVAFDSTWSTAETTAETAMQKISQTVTTEAQTAAQAVKSAFENMTITIPKPKIPVIGVSESSVSYGSGGNVSIPKFSVSWNALGGIFDQPTIFNTPAGMQGVGEAGPEAILPLDTLWDQMQDIVSRSVKENTGGSMVDDLVASLQGAGNSGENRYEPAGSDSMVIHWSPTYNLYGSAGMNEIEKADGMSREEFGRYMDQWLKDRDRRAL